MGFCVLGCWCVFLAFVWLAVLGCGLLFYVFVLVDCFTLCDLFKMFVSCVGFVFAFGLNCGCAVWVIGCDLRFLC